MTPHYLIFCFSGQQNKTYYLLKRNKTLGYHILRRNLISCLFYLPIFFRFVTLVFPLDMKLYAFVDNSDFFVKQIFFWETNIFWNKYFLKQVLESKTQQTLDTTGDITIGNFTEKLKSKFLWRIYDGKLGLFLFFNTT